jgi:hypothetical protein
MAELEINYNIDLPSVQNFRDFGTFKNNIDEFGNARLIFSSVSDDSGDKNYLKFDLKTLSYNESKIKDTTDISFSELQTSNSEETRNVNDVLDEYNKVLSENKILNETVNELVDKYENNDDKIVISAMKDEIINLRIKLGQGNVPSDFDDGFPFLPIN